MYLPTSLPTWAFCLPTCLRLLHLPLRLLHLPQRVLYLLQLLGHASLPLLHLGGDSRHQPR